MFLVSLVSFGSLFLVFYSIDSFLEAVQAEWPLLTRFAWAIFLWVNPVLEISWGMVPARLRLVFSGFSLEVPLVCFGWIRLALIGLF
jgi:hypothetical protein